MYTQFIFFYVKKEEKLQMYIYSVMQSLPFFVECIFTTDICIIKESLNNFSIVQ